MLPEISLSKLCTFLCQAKKNTYAGEGVRAPSKCILSKNHLYTEGDFRYEDQYFGEIIDVGEEIVWYKGIPIWGMGYRGGMNKVYIHIKNEIFAFLKKALQNPDPFFPTRGAKSLISEEYSYANKAKGNITSFTGKELIVKENKEVYFRHYIGGLIMGEFTRDTIIIDDLEKII